MSAGEAITLAAVVVTGLGILLREAHAAAIERKRTQPIVIVHERGSGPTFSERVGWWGVGAAVTNAGVGPAFNMRFGIELHGVRFPHRRREDDPEGGTWHRVIRPRPSEKSESATIRLPSLEAPGTSRLGHRYAHPDRLFWCRYQNAYGTTWETRTPAGGSAPLDIRRVRFVRLREWSEARARAISEGIALDRQYVEDIASSIGIPADASEGPTTPAQDA